MLNGKGHCTMSSKGMLRWQEKVVIWYITDCIYFGSNAVHHLLCIFVIYSCLQLVQASLLFWLENVYFPQDNTESLHLGTNHSSLQWQKNKRQKIKQQNNHQSFLIISAGSSDCFRVSFFMSVQEDCTYHLVVRWSYNCMENNAVMYRQLGFTCIVVNWGVSC